MTAMGSRLGLGVATLAGCLAVLFQETDGLRVLTSDRLPVVRSMRGPAFAAPLQTSSGQSLSALPAPDALRVVEITYERCRTICAVQGESVAQAYRALRAEVDSKRLHFVSLSVDPGDCPNAIARRVDRLRAGVDGWDGVCVQHAAARASLARQIGLVVVEDEAGEFRHTAGIYLVGSDDRVVAYEPSLNKQRLVLAIQEALQSGPRPHDG